MIAWDDARQWAEGEKSGPAEGGVGVEVEGG